VLADPQSVTVSATAISLPKLETRLKTNVYQDRTSGITLYVTQEVNKKGESRASASLVKEEIFTDPVTGLKSIKPTSITVASLIPQGGTAATAEALYDGLTTALNASTKALLKRILNGEK
jgi:hypothetical protein